MEMHKYVILSDRSIDPATLHREVSLLLSEDRRSATRIFATTIYAGKVEVESLRPDDLADVM